MYPDKPFSCYQYAGELGKGRRSIVRHNLDFGNVSSGQIDGSHLGSLSGNETGRSGETRRNRMSTVQVTRAKGVRAEVNKPHMTVFVFRIYFKRPSSTGNLLHFGSAAAPKTR